MDSTFPKRAQVRAQKNDSPGMKAEAWRAGVERPRKGGRRRGIQKLKSVLQSLSIAHFCEESTSDGRISRMWVGTPRRDCPRAGGLGEPSLTGSCLSVKSVKSVVHFLGLRIPWEKPRDLPLCGKQAVQVSNTQRFAMIRAFFRFSVDIIGIFAKLGA